MNDLKKLIALMAGDYLDQEAYCKALLFIDYLQEAHLTDKAIFELSEKGWLFQYSDLPKTLWEDSLLKPYTYYYHSKLKQISAPCVFNPITCSFTESLHYNEMRISLTLEEVISDMYSTLHTLPEFQHIKRDTEALKHILEKHRFVQLNGIRLETIDIVYAMFDKASTTNYGPRLNFLELFNQTYTSCLAAIEENLIVPQKHFTLRTGEMVMCHGQ